MRAANFESNKSKMGTSFIPRVSKGSVSSDSLLDLEESLFVDQLVIYT